MRTKDWAWLLGVTDQTIRNYKDSVQKEEGDSNRDTFMKMMVDKGYVSILVNLSRNNDNWLPDEFYRYGYWKGCLHKIKMTKLLCPIDYLPTLPSVHISVETSLSDNVKNKEILDQWNQDNGIVASDSKSDPKPQGIFREKDGELQLHIDDNQLEIMSMQCRASRLHVMDLYSYVTEQLEKGRVPAKYLAKEETHRESLILEMDAINKICEYRCRFECDYERHGMFFFFYGRQTAWTKISPQSSQIMMANVMYVPSIVS